MRPQTMPLQGILSRLFHAHVAQPPSLCASKLVERRRPRLRHRGCPLANRHELKPTTLQSPFSGTFGSSPPFQQRETEQK